MKYSRRAALATITFILMVAPVSAQDIRYAWSPKPDRLPSYGRNFPVTRLPAVLARHKGQARWNERVILTRRYDARWIQAAPGDRTPAQYYGDDRVVWVVWHGRIRFHIEGQQPFVATKGFLVEVPQRVRYSLETVGTEPSLRLEVTRAGIRPSYPADKGQPKPPQAGADYIKISTPTQPDTYDAVNRPYVDFFKAADKTVPVRHVVVADEANRVDIIRGPGMRVPSINDRGHFHNGADEFWFVLEGKCDYLIEGVGRFTANQSDIAFVPPGRFYHVSCSGQRDARLSFTVSPHLFDNFAAGP